MIHLRSIVVAMAVFAFAFGFTIGSGDVLIAGNEGPGPTGPCEDTGCGECSCCKVNGEWTYNGGTGTPCEPGVCIPPGGCDPPY